MNREACHLERVSTMIDYLSSPIFIFFDRLTIHPFVISIHHFFLMRNRLKKKFMKISSWWDWFAFKPVLFRFKTVLVVWSVSLWNVMLIWLKYSLHKGLRLVFWTELSSSQIGSHPEPSGPEISVLPFCQCPFFFSILRNARNILVSSLLFWTLLWLLKVQI